MTNEPSAVTGGQVSITKLSRETQNAFSLALAVSSGAQASEVCREWIVECPGGGEARQFGQPEISLANFNAVNFTAALACNRKAGKSRAAWGDPSMPTVVTVETGRTPSTVLTETTTGSGTATIPFGVG